MDLENIAIALTDEAAELLMPMLLEFRTHRWSSDKERPTCVLCESADFSGHLVEANVLLKDKEMSPLRIWIPHSYVALAFDFSQGKTIGFLRAK